MAMDEVKGMFRIELMSLIAKYYPFSPAEVNSIFEATKSVNGTIKIAELARLGATDMHTALDSVVGSNNFSDDPNVASSLNAQTYKAPKYKDPTT